MALWELDEFQGARFLGFVRNVPTPAPFAGANWLPDQTIFDLAFEYILGTDEQPVMAHVMGWDSEAPIHGRPGLGTKVAGELPPIKRKAKISEKELIRFLTPRAGVPDRQVAIDSVYDLTRNLLDSVQARVEWLRLQALSENTVVYNEGGVIFDFDYGLNDLFQWDITTALDGAGGALPVGVAPADWSDTVNSKPVTDMLELCNRVEDVTGFRPGRHVMSRKSLGYLLQNDSVRTLIRGATAPTSPITRIELDTVLDLHGLPPIVTYDVKVRSEQANGTFVEVRPLAENKSFLLPPAGTTLGSTLWGPTAESRPLIGTALASEAPGIFAVTYGMEEPPSEWIKAVGVAFPSMPGAALLSQMKLW